MPRPKSCWRLERMGGQCRHEKIGRRLVLRVTVPRPRAAASAAARPRRRLYARPDLPLRLGQFGLSLVLVRKAPSEGRLREGSRDPVGWPEGGVAITNEFCRPTIEGKRPATSFRGFIHTDAGREVIPPAAPSRQRRRSQELVEMLVEELNVFESREVELPDRVCWVVPRCSGNACSTVFRFSRIFEREPATSSE